MEAEIERFDQYQQNVHVKYIKPPNKRTSVPIHKIRQLLPPIHANIKPNPGLNDANINSKPNGSSLNGDLQGSVPNSQVDTTGLFKLKHIYNIHKIIYHLSH